MKSKEILIQIIEQLDEFENQCKKVDMEVNMSDFIGFLNANIYSRGIKAQSISGGQEEYPGGMAATKDRETDISILIVMMYRYAKSYLKKAFANSIIRTADEFSYLITLLTHESMVKTELIHTQVMEKTSGMEIIKRLIRLNLVESFDDPIDKRSTRIRISDEGKRELGKIFPQMQLVSRLVPGDLNEAERNQLAYLLRRLDHFHHHLYQEAKTEPLENLVNN